jgi:GT2 family glycosyltransferase
VRTITIVTPWMNHMELCEDYFEAILPELEKGDKYIVIDNASDPPLPFASIQARINLGFTRASNLGLRRAKTDAVLFLNNDIAKVRDGWLDEIRELLEPKVLVGPLRYGFHASVDGTSLPYLDGWCLAGMREDLMFLGGFDTRLQEPAYYSDNLLCLTARSCGMRLRDVRPGLLHKESATSRPWENPAVDEASAANRALYLAAARSVLQAA